MSGLQRNFELAASVETRCPAIPQLPSGQTLDLAYIRDRGEFIYLPFIVAANLVVIVAFAAVTIVDYTVSLMIVGYAGAFGALMWIAWKLTYWYIYGNSILVGPNQYPQIYRVVQHAAQILGVPVPTILILHGHGLVELFVAKRFTRRGVIILTSNLLDALVEGGSSRELMMIVGRQLGHIKAGHFRLWFLEVWEQRTVLFESWWARVRLVFSAYPYLVDRIVQLRRFAALLEDARPGATERARVGALPLQHCRIRALPIMVVHGHDRMALLEVKDFLHTKFPYVNPVVMTIETLGAVSLPEKFETLASQVKGVIALLTPDDFATTMKDGAALAMPRARQNVILEIGWFWGRLGRRRCLALCPRYGNAVGLRKVGLAGGASALGR
jgi:hypothetical protein